MAFIIIIIIIVVVVVNTLYCLKLYVVIVRTPTLQVAHVAGSYLVIFGAHFTSPGSDPVWGLARTCPDFQELAGN